jgi:adenosylcobyric acid synthase
MMGVQVEDPLHVESTIPQARGLGLLPVYTTLRSEKTTRQIHFHFLDCPDNCSGYEIHMGETGMITPYRQPDSQDQGIAGGPESILDHRPLNHFPDGHTDGYFLNEKCWGTYIHGLFDNACVIDRLLAPYTDRTGERFDYREYKEAQYDKLAALMRQHIDMEQIYKILQY